MQRLPGKLMIPGLILAGATLLSNPVMAHEFTAAIFAFGDDPQAELSEAVQGFLLAADERDGHMGDTSDGHLGGVDVNILPLPAEAAAGIAGLNGRPSPSPDVAVILGSGTEKTQPLPEALANVVTLRPGRLPDRAVWADASDAESFAARYRDAYGTEPGEAAAQGYNAARRLEAAIRPLDGTEPQTALAAGLAETEAGIEW